MLRISYKMQVICLVWGKYNSSIENKNRRDRSLVKPDSVWGDGKGFLPRRQDNPCLITTKIRLGKFSFGQVYFRFNSCYLVVRCHAAMFIFSLSVSKTLLNHTGVNMPNQTDQIHMNHLLKSNLWFFRRISEVRMLNSWNNCWPSIAS